MPPKKAIAEMRTPIKLLSIRNFEKPAIPPIIRSTPPAILKNFKPPLFFRTIVSLFTLVDNLFSFKSFDFNTVY